MFCTQCGTQMGDARANFCPQCGQETPESMGRRATARKRLFRSRYDRQLAGVCAGFADYVDADVTLIRILAVAAVLFSGGLAFLIYLAGWIMMPQEPVMLREAQTQQPEAS